MNHYLYVCRFTVSWFSCISCIGNATTSDILEAFRESLTELSMSKVIQETMDGQSVNWKFIKSLTAIKKQVVSAR